MYKYHHTELNILLFTFIQYAYIQRSNIWSSSELFHYILFSLITLDHSTYANHGSHSLQLPMTCPYQRVSISFSSLCSSTSSAPRTNSLMTLATVQKIVTEILPASTGVSFSKDARDLLIECCVEFITLISSEANEISEKEAKKTIACDHITKALDTLGFGDFVPAVLEAAAHHKESQRVSLLDVRWLVSFALN